MAADNKWTILFSNIDIVKPNQAVWLSARSPQLDITEGSILLTLMILPHYPTNGICLTDNHTTIVWLQNVFYKCLLSILMHVIIQCTLVFSTRVTGERHIQTLSLIVTVYLLVGWELGDCHIIIYCANIIVKSLQCNKIISV